MKQEVFVGIINTIQTQKEREERFAEAIKNAYIDAGECSDFRDSNSYLPPTTVLVDDLIMALAKEFVSENQTLDCAADMINYFLYELPIMGYVFMEPIDPKKNNFEVKPVPAYVVHQNGTKLRLDSPEFLYQALVYSMDTPATVEPSKVSANVRIGSAVENISVENETDLWEPEFSGVYIKLIPIIKDVFMITDVNSIKLHTRFREDLNATNTSLARLTSSVEKKFGFRVSDEEYVNAYNDIHTVEDAIRAIIKKQELSNL